MVPPTAVLLGSSEAPGDVESRRPRSLRARSNRSGRTAKFEMKLVNPANKRKYKVIVVGSRPRRRRRRGRRSPSSATTSRASASRTRRAARTRSPRRAASTPRRTTRTTATRFTGCSTTPSRAATSAPREAQRASPRRGLGRHHRSVRRDGRAVRARVRRHAGEPQLRRRAGVAHVLRARPDRPAAAARRLLGARAPDRRRQGQDVPAHRDARRRRRERPRGRHRRARPRHRHDHLARRARRDPRDRRLRQRVLPVDQREGLQRHRDVPRVQEGRRVREPVLHADPPDLHPGLRRLPVEADADVRVAAQRRPRLGAEDEGRHREAPGPDRRRRIATTTSSASTRASATCRRATSRAAPRRSSATTAVASVPAAAACTSTSATRSSATARTRSARSTATCSTCTSGSPARTRIACRCGSIRPSTTRWAGCGSTTTCRPRSPACSASARRTSPTTARTASAPRR